MNDPQSSGKELPAGTRLEEFVIERVLGSGGFGITYLATDTKLSRQVVIKENLPSQFAYRDTTSLVVNPGSSREDEENFRWSIENFSREAMTLAGLDHPGVVQVLRSFEAFGTSYFVMPFIDGRTLEEVATEYKSQGLSFSEDELQGLLERLLDALQHLHEEIAHRLVVLRIKRQVLPMLKSATRKHQRQVMPVMAVGIAKVAAKEHHRVVQQAAIGLLLGLE